jgi:hypothetical protein
VTREPSEIQFLVNKLLYLESRKLCAIAGYIVTGTIKPGMNLHAPVDSSQSITIRIDEIAFMTRANESLVCLMHKCKRKTFDRFESYGIVGQTLEITLAGTG